MRLQRGLRPSLGGGSGRGLELLGVLREALLLEISILLLYFDFCLLALCILVVWCCKCDIDRISRPQNYKAAQADSSKA